MVEKVDLKIAGIGLRVESEEAETIGQIARYCGKFISPKAAGGWTLRLDRRAKLPQPAREEKPVWDAERFESRGLFFQIRGDARTKTIEMISTRRPGWGDLLRAAAGVLFVRLGGFLLHGAAALSGDRAFVFFGPSGRGKTTLSRLAEKAGKLILTDESVALLPGPDGKTFYAWATPFYGELGRVTVNAGAPVAFAARLDHGGANRLTPFSKGQLFSHLVRNCFFFPGNRCSIEALFDNVEKMAARVPGFSLQFLPDKAVWEFLDDRFELQTSAK